MQNVVGRVVHVLGWMSRVRCVVDFWRGWWGRVIGEYSVRRAGDECCVVRCLSLFVGTRSGQQISGGVDEDALIGVKWCDELLRIASVFGLRFYSSCGVMNSMLVWIAYLVHWES